MTRDVINNIFRFVLLWAAQVFVLNHINLSVLFNPMIYPLFIMLLPYETPRWLVILFGFLMGLFVDFFSGSFGLNASAGALIGFLRPYILNLIEPLDGYSGELSLGRMGLKWFLYYVVIIIVIHHSYFFIIQTFSFAQFFALITRILLSSALSCLLIIIVEYLFPAKKTV